mmetsp:Transcript_12900/g.37441  ORF Transcript_12900/g.37441 Transcript_12900/m.37441 type:complete len:220 (+) Transcript_12900:1568-2227(+)
MQHNNGPHQTAGGAWFLLGATEEEDSQVVPLLVNHSRYKYRGRAQATPIFERQSPISIRNGRNHRSCSSDDINVAILHASLVHAEEKGDTKSSNFQETIVADRYKFGVATQKEAEDEEVDQGRWRRKTRTEEDAVAVALILHTKDAEQHPSTFCDIHGDGKIEKIHGKADNQSSFQHQSWARRSQIWHAQELHILDDESLKRNTGKEGNELHAATNCSC